MSQFVILGSVDSRTQNVEVFASCDTLKEAQDKYKILSTGEYIGGEDADLSKKQRELFRDIEEKIGLSFYCEVTDYHSEYTLNGIYELKRCEQ